MMDKAPEALLGEMSIMDGSGHKHMNWNTDRLDEIAAAKESFDSLVKKGYSCFASKKKIQPKHLIREFDPTMGELVMVPRIFGG